MSKYKKPTINRKPNGGIKKAGQFLGNAANAEADIALSAVGLNNVIPDSAYQGSSANDFRNISRVGGSIEKTVLPMALSAVGVPPSVTVMGQNMIGQFNPNDPNQTQQSKQMQMTGQGVGQMAGMAMKMAGQFPFGGQNSSPVQLEKQEIFQTPNGQMGQVNGPTHANGGVNLNLPENSRIFSDRLKASSGKTYAEESARFKTEKWQKILDNPASDSFSRNAAKRMLEVTNTKLDALFNEQESYKQMHGLNDDGSKVGDNENAETTPDNEVDEHANGGIHIKKSHEGRFTEYKKRTGKTTEEALHSKDPHVRQMANFARNASHWKHKPDGGTAASTEQVKNVSSNGTPMVQMHHKGPDGKDQLLYNTDGTPMMRIDYQVDKNGNPIPPPQQVPQRPNGGTSDFSDAPYQNGIYNQPLTIYTPHENQVPGNLNLDSDRGPYGSYKDVKTIKHSTVLPEVVIYGKKPFGGVQAQPINSTIQAMPVANDPLAPAFNKPLYQQGTHPFGAILDSNGNPVQTPGSAPLPAYLQGPNITPQQRAQYYTSRGLSPDGTTVKRPFGGNLPSTISSALQPDSTLPIELMSPSMRMERRKLPSQEGNMMRYSYGGTNRQNYGGGGGVGPVEQYPFGGYGQDAMQVMNYALNDPTMAKNMEGYNPNAFNYQDPNTTVYSNDYSGNSDILGPGQQSIPARQGNADNTFQPKLNTQTLPGTPMSTPDSPTAKQAVNPGFIAASAGNFLGAAYDIYRGAKGPAQVNYDRIKPNLVDYSQSRDLTARGLNQSFRDTRKAIQEGTGGGAGNYLSNVNNAAANRDTMIRDNYTTSIENQNNQNALIKNTAAGSNAQIQMLEANARQQEKDISSNILSKGLYNAGSATSQLGRDTQMKAYDPMIAKLIATGDYSYDYYNPQTGKMDFTKPQGIKHAASGKTTYFVQ